MLPQQCFACGAGSGDGVLCQACLDSLPGAGMERCPVCALPAPGAQTCGACLARVPPYEATLASLDYAFPVDRIVHALKYVHRLAVVRLFIDLLARQPVPEADLVVPMPLHEARLRQRGFNQAAELARPLARHWGLPVLLDGVVRDLDTRPQAGLPWGERVASMRGAFRVRRPLEGLRIVVLDDVMTTGATLAELALSLKAAGAARVENRVVARTPPPA
ncbi:MAG: ComF family protein [Zoogloea sp.]|nr:MAG: ComF family protein [Zoogloea sp.]